MQSDDQPANLTPSQVAAMLNVHRDTVVRWANTGKLPFWRTPSGDRKFRRADIERILETEEAS